MFNHSVTLENGTIINHESAEQFCWVLLAVPASYPSRRRAEDLRRYAATLASQDARLVATYGEDNPQQYVQVNRAAVAEALAEAQAEDSKADAIERGEVESIVRAWGHSDTFKGKRAPKGTTLQACMLNPYGQINLS